MRCARRFTPFAIALVLGALAPAAGASPAQSPTPVAGEPSCDGLIIADFNHDTTNPFNNPNSSAGPGPFFHQGTHDAIEELARGPFCGT
jgi:hypothetical protein